MYFSQLFAKLENVHTSNCKLNSDSIHHQYVKSFTLKPEIYTFAFVESKQKGLKVEAGWGSNSWST